MESLEGRLLFAQTPSLRAESLGKAFDLGERQALLARMNNLPATTYTALAKNLKSRNVQAFDNRLLSYMRSRNSGAFFYKPSEAASLASYVEEVSSPAHQIKNAADVTDRRLLPEQGSVSRYTIKMPADINWSDGSKSSNPEFLPSLNRMDWWPDLAQSHLYTGESKYLSELRYELADWSQENPTFRLPERSSQNTSYAFGVAIRVENWLHTYFSVLGSSGWSGADNSLMLYKLAQQGDILASVGGSTTKFTSNRSISIGRSELYLGLTLPEIDNAAQWEAGGRAMLYNALDAQFYADGSHREQSPSYAGQTIDALLDARRLDAVNGNKWDNRKQKVLIRAVDALWQQLSPNGNRPAIGDTYRGSATGLFLKASLVLGDNRWPEAKPRPHDVWLFGRAVEPYRRNAASPAIGNRGKEFSLPDGGNYILRSGSDASARQINFDAGPKGGGHGHSDLLSFEFFGYGRPLIADPGPYLYDTSAKRTWAVSTKAHSTVGVADLNHGDVETNAGIVTTGLKSVGGGTMISAGHQGYFFTDGTPTVSRSMWYDGNNTIVVVDFVEATKARNFEQSFLVQNQNTSRTLANGLVYTKNGSGGNVRVQSLLRPGQTTGLQTSNIFTTSKAPPSHVDAASRYYVQQLGTTHAVFATLITAHNGSAARASASASWVTIPAKPGQSAVLKINGQNITFSPPAFDRLNARAQSRGTHNDIAYDNAGRLHMVYFDRDDLNLKYAVREKSGAWSTVQTIDADAYAGYTPSLAIDEDNRPGVAYQDAANGDLRYAYLSPITNAWSVQKVDVKGSTGAYPSLVFNRNNSPSIAYYNKSKGDLRLAQADTSAWRIETLDSKGDVGRFPSLQLDPNRASSSKFAVAYEDTTHGSFKYAVQSRDGYERHTVDDTTTIGGGYISMKFYDSGSGSRRYKPALSYYDAGNGQLKYAYDKDDGDFVTSVVADGRRQGLYSKLAIEGNTPRIFFYDGGRNRAVLVSGTKISGGKWSGTDLGAGGRDIHFAARKGGYVYTSLDERTGTLAVGSINV
jgi:hypothetical protein